VSPFKRQFGDRRLLQACVSHDHGSETYTYRNDQHDTLVVGRQFHLLAARLMPFADSIEVVFDGSFGGGRTCPPDPVWGAPYPEAIHRADENQRAARPGDTIALSLRRDRSPSGSCRL
jgi:hypothetical protein